MNKRNIYEFPKLITIDNKTLYKKNGVKFNMPKYLNT